MTASHDVIIVGAGAAGLTAALYTARRGLSTLVLSQDIGGQAATTATVENYPGFDSVDGLDLMMKFKAQAEKYGAQVVLDEVTKINRRDNEFLVRAVSGAYAAPTMILAHGLTHKRLDVLGEERLRGKGVSYCATCDAPLFKGKAVAVVGGGNSAMDAALLLAQFCPRVYLLTSNDEFHGERILIDRLAQTAAIQTLTNAVTKEIHGAETVTGFTYETLGAVKQLDVQGVFVEVGYTVNPALMKDLVTLDARNQVIIMDSYNGTNVPGLFAAGDVTTIAQKQIVISAGEGAKAALGVHHYLQALGRVKKTELVDWGVGTPMHHTQKELPKAEHPQIHKEQLAADSV